MMPPIPRWGCLALLVSACVAGHQYKGERSVIYLSLEPSNGRIWDVRLGSETLNYGGVELAVPSGSHTLDLKFEIEERSCARADPFCVLSVSSGGCHLPVTPLESDKTYFANVHRQENAHFLRLSKELSASGAREEIAVVECELSGTTESIELLAGD